MDIIEYQVNHPLIISVLSKEFESGIITICFNCTEFNIVSHSYSESEYIFDKSDSLEFSELPKVKLDSEHILKLEAGWYNKSISQEDEQIIYVYVPIYMMLSEKMWNKHKEKVLSELPQRIDTVLKLLAMCGKEEEYIWKRELRKLELKQKFYEN